MKRIYLTVTNDLNYDQRMQRICNSLQNAGYSVCLVGRNLPKSRPLTRQIFEQKRLTCYFHKGKFFYIEYNIRLFIFLFFQKDCQALCAIDLDTILPCLWVAKFRHLPCLYDAHEYFTEVPEVVERPKIQRLWQRIADYAIPQMRAAYTVSPGLAEIFTAQYQMPFACIRNLPVSKAPPYHHDNPAQGDKPFILLYQGALNEGRGLETALEALALLPPRVQLWLVGEGDLSQALRQQAQALGLSEPRLKFWGFVLPMDLPKITAQAHIGLNLLEHKGESYYYSLANKFFDYVQARIPSVNPYFPEYRAHLAEFQTGMMLEKLEPQAFADLLHYVLENPKYYQAMQAQCDLASQHWTWEEEEKVLLAFYEKNLS